MRFRLRDIAISIKVGLAPGFVLCTLIGMALVAIVILGASKDRIRDLSEGPSNVTAWRRKPTRQRLVRIPC